MMRACFSMCALLACLSTSIVAQRGAPGVESKAVKPAALVNLNTATVAELEALPGIGPAVAARIVEYRTKQGPFRKIEELMNVQGIGEKMFLRLKPQITVAPKPAGPVDSQN